MGICEGPSAQSEIAFLISVEDIMRLCITALNLFMGVSVSIYLAWSRKRRNFPRFVVFQLLLVDAVYFLQIWLDVWKKVHHSAEQRSDTG